ncbi:hypothetical protein DL769_009141 [Monosporascus sp. CRB-8-3]|nr:hypothetical protein DL769_009141 [Monosporascus sp. CRB-8-3]
MAPTFVLITGGNRGLGQGLVKSFLALPEHTVIAAVRDPGNTTSQALADLPKGQGSALIVVKYDAAVEQDAYDVAKELQEKHNIDHLDIVVPNAGIVEGHPLVKDVKTAGILKHLHVNVFGVIALYQALRDLLQKSPNNPIFAPMGSTAGSCGRQPPVPNAMYGASKSMLQWYGVRINAEDEWLNTFILDPGWVQTDMGNTTAKRFGVEEAPTTVRDSVAGLFQVLTTATNEEYGGKVVLYTGEPQAY